MQVFDKQGVERIRKRWIHFSTEVFKRVRLVKGESMTIARQSFAVFSIKHHTQHADIVKEFDLPLQGRRLTFGKNGIEAHLLDSLANLLPLKYLRTLLKLL